MKKLAVKVFAVLAIAITTAVSAFGQNGFAYQAVIRDANGELVTNKSVEVKFALKHDNTVYYSEKQTVTTNEFGNIQVTVGNGEKLDGSFDNVPWNTFSIKMQVSVDVDGKGDVVLGEVPVSGAPYAMYAQKAGGVTSKTANTKDGDALFAVNDANGNPVFAVFDDGIVVYVDDTDAAKAKRSGFVVTGRAATKNEPATEYFSVTAEGTQIYVDDIDADKAKRSGFVVTGRAATKDGDAADYLTVGGEGTTVFVDPDSYRDSSKAKRSGFVVTGRAATKDGDQAQYFVATADGTTIYVDDTSADKAKRSGFVVTGRAATKDGDADNYLEIDGDGTQVYVDGLDSDKAKRSGFVVTGRAATKAEEDTLFAIEGGYTRVYVDDDEADKAKRSGFVVTGRAATKDTTQNNIFNVSGAGDVAIQANEFLVTEQIKQDTTDSVPVMPKNVFSIVKGTVEVGGEMTMTGDVEKKVDADTISLDSIGIELPKIAKIVDRADTVNCSLFQPFIYGDDDDANGYALLGIYSKGSYTKVTADDQNGNLVLLIDAGGNVTKKQKSATVAVLMPKGDSQLYIRPLQATNQTIAFGLMKKNAVQPYQYIKVEVEVEASAGVPYNVDLKAVGGGRVLVMDGSTMTYGGKVMLSVEPDTGYVFAGWHDGNLRVKRNIDIYGDTVITARFERVNLNVKVTSDNSNYGSAQGSGTYEFGQIATLVAVPVEGYSFSHWTGVPEKLQYSDSINVAVRSEMKAVAHFVPNKYTIRFNTNGGSAIDSITADYGAKLSNLEPEAPERDGYEFAGWDEAFPTTMPLGGLTLNASWEVKAYKVTFVLDGDEYFDDEYDFGTPISAIANKVAVETPEGYTFSGWQCDYDSVPAEPINIVGSFKANEYSVTFKVDGKEFKTVDSVAYGTKLAAIADTIGEPEKDGYKFSGWQNVPATMPDSAITINGEFVKSAYNIIYVVDGTPIDTVETECNTTIVTIKEPVKEGYKFSGWQNVPAIMPDSSITISGSFTVIEYAILFVSDADTLQSTKVAYGQTPKYTGNEPTREADKLYTYKFNSWTPAIAEVTGEQVYTAVFDSIERKYTILFMSDGDTLFADTLAYGAPIKYAVNNPTREADTLYTYEFSGWTPEVTAVKGNQTYTAVFDTTIRWYTVTFMNGDDTLRSRDYTYGQLPEFVGQDPVKEATAQYSYSFIGWVPTIVKVIADQTYAAAFDSTLNKYEIVFVSDEYELQKDTLAYGQTPKYTGAEPTREPDEQFTFKFSGWEPAIAEVTGNQTYMAAFDTIGADYEILFVNGTETLQTSTLGYGQTPEYTGDEPTREANERYTYSFKGWTPEIDKVKGNQTYTAEFDSAYVNYVVKFYGAGGKVLYYNAEAHYGDTIIAPNTDSVGYEFQRWNPAIPTPAIVTEDFGTTGSWKARTDVEYTVNIFLQDVDGNYDAEYPTESITCNNGTTNTETNYQPADTTGFTLDLIKQTVVSGDGQSAVLVYYKRNSHQLTWDANGGQFDNGNTIITDNYYYGANIEQPKSNPTRDGHDFDADSWSKNVPATMPDNNLTIKANWTLVTYSINYYDTAGSGFVPDFTSYNITQTITIANPTKKGFVFEGWTGTFWETATKSITISGKTGPIDLVATWSESPVKYTVTHLFEKVGGGYDSTVEEFSGRDGDYTTAVAKDITGFEADEFSQQPIAADNSTNVEIYYSRIKYKLIFNGNGGWFGVGVESTYVDTQFGTTLSATEARPTRDGYTFLGWPDLSGRTMPAKDTIIYAEWKANTNTVYKVNTWLQDTLCSDYTMYREGEEQTGTTDAVISYKFDIDGFTQKAFDETTIAGDGKTVIDVYYDRLRYKAIWKVNDTVYAETEKPYDSKIKLPSEPKSVGREFIAWVDDNDAEFSAEELMPFGGKTFYALFDTLYYSVTLPEGMEIISSEVPANDEKYKYDTKVSFKVADGYVISGYVTANGEQLYEVDGVYELTIPAEDVTISAELTKLHTVRFFALGGEFADGTNMKTVVVPHNSTISDVDSLKPIWDDHTMMCWLYYIEGNQDPEEYKFSNLITRDTMILAEWVLTTIYVAKTGTAEGDGTSASPLATIANAVQMIKAQGVTNFDFTIKVKDTIKESVVIPATLNDTIKSLTIQGVKDASASKIVAKHDSTALVVNTAVPVTIQNLTITGGKAQMGGGIYVGDSTITADLTLGTGAVVSGNRAIAMGGGVYVTPNSSLTLDGGLITQDTVEAMLYNVADTVGGGGVAVANGASFTIKSGQITANLVYDWYVGSSREPTLVGYKVEGSGVLNYGALAMEGGSVTGNNFSSLYSYFHSSNNEKGYFGNDISHRGGSLSMKDGAVVDTLALGYGLTIDVAGELTSASAIRLEMIDGANDGEYACYEGREVLTGDYVETQYNKFDVQKYVRIEREEYPGGYYVRTLTSYWKTTSAGKLTESFSVKLYTTDFSTFTTQIIDNGGLVTKPDDPEIEGYTFKGWYDPEMDSYYDFSTPVTRSFAIYALFADTLYVDATAAEGGLGTKASPFASLTEASAVMNSPLTDYVVKLSGTFNSATQIIGGAASSITIDGAPATADGTNAVIDGQNTRQCLSMYVSNPVIIRNLTVKNGYATKGSGGIGYDPQNVSGGQLTLESGVLIDNCVGVQGGGVAVFGDLKNYNQKGRLIIKPGVVISNCTATSQGGGVYMGYGDIIMEGGTIVGNKAIKESSTTSKCYGGGIFFGGTDSSYDSNFTMTGGTISGNTARTSGNGIYMGGANLTLGDSAKVDFNNDVYLRSAQYSSYSKMKTITVVGGFTSDTVAVITPADGFYLQDTVALVGTESILAADCGRFLVTNQVTNDGTFCWKVNSAGKLEKVTGVTFIYNDGTNHSVTLPVNENNLLTNLPSDPEREGFLFRGWYGLSNDGMTVSNTEFDSSVEFTKDTTVIAQWEQTTYYVGDSDHGGDYYGEGTAASPYASFAQVLDSIAMYGNSNRDYTIKVKGKLVERITISSENLDNKAQTLTIEGADRRTVTVNGETIYEPADTLKQEGSYTVVTVTTKVPVTFCDIVITGGGGNNGGGIYVNTNSTVILADSAYITGNNATNYGGGVYCAGHLEMRGGQISDNTAKSGGGVYINMSSEFIMSDGIISNNSASNNGGAVYVDPGASFKMDNMAYIPAGVLDGGNLVTGNGKNDVYLDGEGVAVPPYITIIGDLWASGPVATITPSSYENWVLQAQVQNNNNGGNVGGDEGNGDEGNGDEGNGDEGNGTGDPEPDPDPVMEDWELLEANYYKFAVTPEYDSDEDKYYYYRTNQDGYLEEQFKVEFVWYYFDKDSVEHREVYQNTFIDASGESVETPKISPVKGNNSHSTAGDFLGWYWFTEVEIGEEEYEERLVKYNGDYLEENTTIYGVWKETIDVSADGPVKSIAKAVSLMDRYCEYTINVTGRLDTAQVIAGDANMAKSITLQGLNGQQTIDAGWVENDGSWTNKHDKNNSGNYPQTPALSINTRVPVTIKNLKITGGYQGQAYTKGGGISIGDTADVTIADGVLITGNRAYSGGGVNIGFGNYATTLRMTGGQICGNTATIGGGVCISNYAKMFMSGSAIVGDTAIKASATAESYSNKSIRFGGGIKNGGWLYLGYTDEETESEFTGGVFYNYAGEYGGGIESSSSEYFMSGGYVAYNAANNGGGGLGIVDGYGKFRLSGGEIVGNATNGKGGGIYCVDEYTSSDDDHLLCGTVSIASNTANNVGKGVYVGSYTPFAISESAIIEADNDIYLNGVPLIIAGGLGGDLVATISPASYTTETKVLDVLYVYDEEEEDEIPVTALEDEYGKFRMADSDWTINEEGYLNHGPLGAIYGKFSVGAGRQVYFSQGNLQYQASTETWRFAERQCDFVGDYSLGNVYTHYEDDEKCDNANIDANYTGWIDLFGWGTGDNPTEYDEDDDVYSEFTDWGTKPIINGGNKEDQWRTLTIDEWEYLLGRSNKHWLATVAIDGSMYNGLVIMPDNWNGTVPTGTGSGYIETSNFDDLAEAGAVFLPTAGYRSGISVSSVGYDGGYWTETTEGEANARYMSFNSGNVYTGANNRHYGISVRLVQDVPVQTTFYVSPNGNDDSGKGTFFAPYASVSRTLTQMVDNTLDYTVILDGVNIDDMIIIYDESASAKSITIKGADGTSNHLGIVYLQTDVPFIFENLRFRGVMNDKSTSNLHITLGEGAIAEEQIQASGCINVTMLSGSQCGVISSDGSKNNVVMFGGEVTDKINVFNDFVFKMGGDARPRKIDLATVYPGNDSVVIINPLTLTGVVDTIMLHDTCYIAGKRVLVVEDSVKDVVSIADIKNRFVLGDPNCTIDDDGKIVRIAPQGVINSLFSVDDGRQVYFSQGNLQYNCYQWEEFKWRFASHQYDFVGDDDLGNVTQYGDKCSNTKISNDEYMGWIDLFGWNTANNPRNASTDDSEYSGDFIDWGSNPIINGGYEANLWRTLTNGEWDYLLNTRITASGKRYAKATVHGVNGLVLLPDDWNTDTYAFDKTNTGNTAFETVTDDNWSTIESAGAVFLPLAGYRTGTDVSNVGSSGTYWSATAGESGFANDVDFNSTFVNTNNVHRNVGRSVRLVQDVVEENGGGDDGITLYVDPDGDDEGDGTENLPFGTLEQAYLRMTEAKEYTIELLGDLSEAQYIGVESSVKATKITIDGKNQQISTSSSEPLLNIVTQIPVEIKNLTITGNNGADWGVNGGGLYVSENSKVTLGKGTKIINNSANYGGGVYNSGQLIIAGAEISGNTAENDGGGVCVGGGVSIEMKSGKISGNTAGGSGGGIYFYADIVTLTGGTISGNIANGSEGFEGGGAIYAGCQSEFYMGDSIYIPAGATVAGAPVTGYGKNDIKLQYDSDYGQSNILIVSNLTAEASVVATITPEDYSDEGAVVLGYNLKTEQLDAALLAANYTKFAVTPQTNPAVAWTIGSDGKLAKDLSGSNNGGSNNGTSWLGTEGGHQWVDLGLMSGTKWATMNVGATSDTAVGSLFSYDLAEYTDPWEGDWQVATKQQWQELLDSCYWEFSSETVDGKYITGYNVYKTKNKADKGKFSDPVAEYTSADAHIFVATHLRQYAGDNRGDYWPGDSEVNGDDADVVHLEGASSSSDYIDNIANRYPIRLVYSDFAFVEEGTISQDYNVGWNDNDYENDDMIISNLLVCKHLVSQYEYEKLMTYYGKVNDDHSELQPSETSEESKRSTPAYYVSWIDAIIYCNLRSEAEGLEPVYDIDDITDPKAEGKWEYWSAAQVGGKYYSNDISDGTGWDSDGGNFHFNFSANGYRLPTSAEYNYILQGDYPQTITNGNYNEWCNNYKYDSECKRVWYDGEKDEVADGDNAKYNYTRESNMGFRVVRNAPVQP